MLSLVAWIIPIFFSFLLTLLLFTHNNKGLKLRINELREILGKLLFDILLISHILLWVVPFNGLFIFISFILPFTFYEINGSSSPSCGFLMNIPGETL